jgi:AcrR family transcriptional regulator
MGIKRRAITDEQKEERRQEILRSAQYLFQKISYNSLSMAQIAKNAGIAKGTIFLYFGTKEELFFALSWQEYQRCFNNINAGVSKYLVSTINCSIEEFIDILQIAFTENQLLLRLIAINSVVLEQNVNYTAAFKFKMMLAGQIRHTSILIEKVMPFLRQGEGRMILLQLQALAIGIQHLAEPAPIIKKVILDEQLSMFRINFDEFFFAAIRAILKGLEARSTSHN